jgi:penicillin-binding protein 2
MWMGRTQAALDEMLFGQRLKVVVALALACFSLVVIRLFALQILEGGRMQSLSERNRLQLIFLRAPRGRILDCQGVPMLDNGPSFTVFYSPASSSEDVRQRIQNYLSRIPIFDSYAIQRKLSEARRIRQFVRLAENIPRKVALKLIEDSHYLPGVTVSVEARRAYAPGYPGAHMLGALGEVKSPELLDQSGPVFHPGDLVGRTGIEKTDDPVLRGKNGGLEIEVDSAGRQIQLMRRVEPVEGDDVVLSIDSQVQKAAESALAQSSTGRGAVVAMDPRTGRVVALASFPTFDIGEGLSSSLKDKRLPLFNRAIQGTYPLGSCFKIVTALAALEKGIIQPSTRFNCTGSYTLGTRVFHCWKTHGWNDLYGAIAWSCDVYFFQVARRLEPEILENYAREFGLGAKTGVDISGEASGTVPGPDWARKVGRAWYEGDTLNMSIGQGQVLVTPLQAAVLMSAVATRGLVYRPILVWEIRDPRGNVIIQTTPQLVRRITLRDENWTIIEKALEQVVQEGTGREARIPGWRVLGKTGTAQNPHGGDHAWFVCAVGRPGLPPRLVVSALVENGGHGGVAAIPVAKKVMEAALGLEAPNHVEPAPAR